jgi:AcrR family transcriptional regulator
MPVERARMPGPLARQRLLDAADDLFYEQGIHAVGIERVLKESGVARSSLYQVFPSKDDLVVAYLRERSEWGRRRVEEALADVTDPNDRLLMVFRCLARWMTSEQFRGCPFINAAAEYPDADHPVHQEVLRDRTLRRERFTELVNALPAGDPPGLVDVLMLVYDGALVGADLGDSSSTARTLVSTVRALLEAAPAVTPGSKPRPSRTDQATGAAAEARRS